MIYKNLTIIGTSHIAEQSLKQVETTINNEKPDIIALELDKKRFYALTHHIKRKLRISDIRRIGIKGFLFNLIGAWIEKKLGKYVGVEPGSEMITAINLAKLHHLNIALIDQDIDITLSKISKSLSWKERWNFFADIFKGLVMGKKQIKEYGKKYGLNELDLTKVPSKDFIKTAIKEVKLRYPNIYKVLVEERNYIMADRLSHLMKTYPEKKILAVIGAGHEEDMLKIIKGRLNFTKK